MGKRDASNSYSPRIDYNKFPSSIKIKETVQRIGRYMMYLYPPTFKNVAELHLKSYRIYISIGLILWDQT